MRNGLFFSIGVAVFSSCFLSAATAQGPAAGSASAAAAAQAKQVAQKRAQVQVQQRAQAQIQDRLRGQANAAARRAANAAAQAARRAQRAAGINTKRRGSVEASGEVAAERGSVTARGNAHGRLGIPQVGLLENGDINMEYFDDVFGAYNPFLSPAPGRPGKVSAAAAPQNAAAGRGNSDQGRARGPLRGNVQTTQTRRPPNFNKAIRLRRAEISQYRDQALASGDPQLLEAADAMELALEAFITARAATDGAADRIAGPPGGFPEAAANGEANSRFGLGGPRMAALREQAEAEASAGSEVPVETSGAAIAEPQAEPVPTTESPTSSEPVEPTL